MKRWRRTLLTCALLLLAGAVVNVAVAWSTFAISRSSPGTVVMLGQREPTLPRWHPRIPRVSPGAGNEGLTVNSLGVKNSFEVWRPESGYHRRQAWVCGLPWPALRFVSEVSQGATGNVLPQFTVSTPVRAGHFKSTNGELPANPLLPGFLLNTLFYAAILALPLMFFPLRRRLRARRGRCPNCNYDLAGLDGPCPECGAER